MFGFLSKLLRSRREAKLRREQENEKATQSAKKRDYNRGYRDAVHDLSSTHTPSYRHPERLSPEYFEGYKNGHRDHLAQTERTGRLNKTTPARQDLPKSSAVAGSSSSSRDTLDDDLLLNPTRLYYGDDFKPATRPTTDAERKAIDPNDWASQPMGSKEWSAAEPAKPASESHKAAAPSHSASSTHSSHSGSSYSHSHDSSSSHSSHDSGSHHSSSYDHGSSSYDSGSSFDSGSSSSDSSSW